VAADVDLPTSRAEVGIIAWDVVYARTRPTLVRALSAATGSYDGVEDAIQDAFAEALRRKANDLRSIEGWLYAVALNRLRSHHRRSAVLRRLRIMPPPPPSELERSLQRADIARVLNALSRRERELLIAKHYLGMTQDEIASYMRLPRGTVSKAISRAAARFRELEGER
jgi:RNA polymerase sigma factor (sigma-70 family)